MQINVIINNLDTVSDFKIYSRHNHAYEKLLGNFTLRTFVKSLKNPVRIRKPKFLEEMAKKYPYEVEPSNEANQSLHKTRNKAKEIINNLKIDDNQSIDNKKKKNLTINIRKNDIDLTPNPCTYNPKYDFIFRRIPVTTIYKDERRKETKIDDNNCLTKRKIRLKKIPKNEENNIITYNKNVNLNKKKRLRFINKKSNSTSKTSKTSETLKLNDKENIIKIKINNNDKSENENEKELTRKNKNDSLEEKIGQNKSNNIKKVNNLNKLFKKNKTTYNSKTNISIFSKDSIYLNTQKDSFGFKKKENSILTNSHINKYISNKSGERRYNSELKGVVDFSKMSDRNFGIILNNETLKNPSFYKYEPKFDYITETAKGFNFGFNENRTNYEKKKYLLRKMMCSYRDFSQDYYIIDNSKLNGKK
jgi:hypothetical protein